MKFIKQHLGFILTITITYVVGVMLTIVQYFALDATIIIDFNPDLNPQLKNTINSITNLTIENERNFMKILLDSLIPTTITYVLGCVLVNISELLKEKADEFVFNVFTCMCVMLYALLFAIYVMAEFSILWIFIEGIATALLIFLNIMCYREKFKYRNHNLV